MYCNLIASAEESTLRDGRLKTSGTAIDAILPPVRRFGGDRDEKKTGVRESRTR